MTNSGTCITRLSAWAPGIGNPAEWDEWAQGKRDISGGAKGPELSFAEPMFRRRLSQISKMTVQVVHGLLPVALDTKIFFLSFRGELSRQFQINKMLIEEKTVSPAAFSLSVFNAPVALASMALGLKGGYSALYPGKDSFAAGLKAAEAALWSGQAGELAFVYADEEAPPEYACFSGECPSPAAFGLLLSRTPGQGSVPLPPLESGADAALSDPLVFLKRLLLGGAVHVSP